MKCDGRGLGVRGRWRMSVTKEELEGGGELDAVEV